MFLAGFMVATLSSCYSVTTCVGSLKPDEPAVEVNSVKNHQFLYGLIGGGKTNISDSNYVGDRKNYKVKKSFSVIDGLLNLLTWGIYTPTTTTYYVPLSEVSK